MKKENQQGERIAKAIARAGVCSRREAEKLILEGHVTLDGEVVKSPALNITDTRKILIDGLPIPRKEKTRLWLYHKPDGLVTTARDEKGRKTVFESLPAGMPRVISIGRLDLNSEGLLLLTNDGEFARKFELPESGIERVYRVRVFGRPQPAALEKLKNGITVDGVKYGSVVAEIEKGQGANSWLKVTLREGKNREIRKIMEHLGLKVNKLVRERFGDFTLGNLKPGKVREISPKVVASLLKGEKYVASSPRRKDSIKLDTGLPASPSGLRRISRRYDKKENDKNHRRQIPRKKTGSSRRG